MKLLVVEDEAQILSFLLKGLRADGYEVLHASTGEEGLAMAQQAGIDVIVLTARGETADRIVGLNQGADDYLGKPFEFDELLARIRARLRWRDDEQGLVLHVGGLALDVRTRRIRVQGREVELTAREFELMEMLMRNRGEVLSRELLLSRVWGMEFDPGSNVVDVYIGHLRRKLGEGSIETVRGAGYRLES